MQRYYILFFTLVILFCSLSPAVAGGRGAWVVRFDIDTPEKVREICAKENQSQFDRYLVQVRGRADSWYESSFVTKAEGVDFDPLALILEECLEVEVHVWLNVYYLWTGDTPPEDPNHPYYNDEWILRDRTGRSLKDYSELEQHQRWLEGVYADPASAAYRAYFSDVVRELVTNYDVAGVHLDFVRYPGAFFGGDSKPYLKKMTRQDLARVVNGSGDKVSLAQGRERLAFDLRRAENVTSLVREVKEVMTEVNPDLTLSASVFPGVVEAFLDKGQRWSDWLKEGLLDEIYIMAYFGEPARVQSQISLGKKIADRYDTRMWIGLGAYIKTAEVIRREIAGAKMLGVNDICLFSLGHLLKQGREIGRYLASSADKVVLAPDHEGLAPLVERVVAGNFKADTTTYATDVKPGEIIRLRGIFRYVDGYDDYAKAQAQYEIMQEVQARLQAGESFTELSTELSQAGTKRLGGVLSPLHYRDARGVKMQRLFRLKSGEYSEIIAVHNGFWLYQVLGRD